MYEKIKEKLVPSKNIVVFTGAGMSTESGIPDFRSENGLYSENEFKGFKPEEILSHSFFNMNTEMFFRYYFEKIVHRNAKPNKGHIILAELEKKKYKITVITQNIDGLHTSAGSTNVLELHGSVNRNYCQDCGCQYNSIIAPNGKNLIPFCSKCNGIIRPDVTLYEEIPDQYVFNMAVQSMSDADILFVIGSSLLVQPAAGLINYFKGELFIIINKETTHFDKKADFVIHDSCGRVLEKITGDIL